MAHGGAMSIWVEMQQVQDRWDATSHPHWQRWMAQQISEQDAGAYAAAHAAVVEALADGADWLAAGPGTDRLGQIAEAEREQAARWWDLAQALGAADRLAAPKATRDCAEVWCGGEGGAGRTERLLILGAVAGVRLAVATCALGALASCPERPADARACLVGEAVVACRVHDLAHERLTTVEPVRPAVAISHAEAALSVYWDLLDALEPAVRRPRLIAA
jgi:hypothetical protein